ncbi:MAG TPA: ribbon-helix-helix protein, CopG family [Rhizomicrobium sp.]
MAKSAPKSVTITARIPAALAKKLEAYAKAAKRTRSWVVEDILDRYVDGEIAFIEAVNVGIRELDAGLGIPHEEAMRRLQAHIAMRKRERRKAA